MAEALFSLCLLGILKVKTKKSQELQNSLLQIYESYHMEEKFYLFWWNSGV